MFYSASAGFWAKDKAPTVLVALTSKCHKSLWNSMKKNKEFSDAFDHCLRGCNDRTEFEESWMNMITKFELKDDSWFQRLYGLKEKWCTTLSKDFFLSWYFVIATK